MTPEQLERLLRAGEKLVKEIQLTVYRMDGEHIPSNVRHAAFAFGALLEEARCEDPSPADPAGT